MVFSGLVTACLLAGWPTRRSPSSVNATIEGVVRIPSAFSITFGALPSITATHELVVPRSMPMTLPMVFIPLCCGRSAGPGRRPERGVHACNTSSDPLKLHVKRRPRGVLPHIGGPHWAARQTITNPGTRVWRGLAGPLTSRHQSLSLALPDRRAGRDLKGEAEARQVLARMIVRKGELRKPVVVRARLLALVDRRIEIDEMPAWFPGRLHDDLDVALAVEAAGIARDRVVVDHRVDVGGLAPAHTLEVDTEGGPDGAARHVERQRGRRDPEGALHLRAAGLDPEVVDAAEVVRRLEAEFGAARRVGLGLGDGARPLLPAGAGHAVADDGIPIE